MKRFYLLAIMSILFVSGCGTNTIPGDKINIKTDKSEYTAKDKRSIWKDNNGVDVEMYPISIPLTIKNNHSQAIYYDNSGCIFPVGGDILNDKNEWMTEFLLQFARCTDSYDVRAKLSPGTSLNIGDNEFLINSPSITNGTYRMTFTYYLSKSDYKNKRNPQKAYSNQFVINIIEETKN